MVSRSFFLVVLVLMTCSPAAFVHTTSVRDESPTLFDAVRRLAESIPIPDPYEPARDTAFAEIEKRLRFEADVSALRDVMIRSRARSHEVSSGCDGYCPIAERYEIAIYSCIHRLGEIKTADATQALLDLLLNDEYNWGAHTREEFHVALCEHGELALAAMRTAVPEHDQLIHIIEMIERGERCVH